MPLQLLFSGDLILDEPDAPHWLAGIAPAIRRADCSIGHLEVPHGDFSEQMEGDVPAPGAPLENLNALKSAGFDALTLAGNHIADGGLQGIQQTLGRLHELDIRTCGAGATLGEARCPAVIEVAGRRISLLSYNCVGPEQSWATATRAGCSYLPLPSEDGAPVTPAKENLRITDEALQQLQEDVNAARKGADLVVVALHKGILHTRARLASYERPLAQAAVDFGADIVVGHHAHIVKGIEIYRGKPIFHGLGNGCVVTRALSPNQDHPDRAAWAERRKKLFGFEPDPAYDLAPFHPEAVSAFLGSVHWHEDGSLEAGVVPVFVEPPGRPVLAAGEQEVKVVEYLGKITTEAGLSPLTFEKIQQVWNIS